MKRIKLFLVAIAAAVCAAAVASAALSPRAVRASIIKAALAQTSVHWTSTANGHGQIKRVADVNAASGAEQATFDGSSAQILRVDDTAYVQGDAVALQLSLGLTQAQATQYAGQWISIPKGDQYYADTVRGLTLASIVHEARPGGKLKVFFTHGHGPGHIILRGTSHIGLGSYSMVSAHASRMPLPVSFSSGTVGHSLHGKFSKWNEAVTVTAPATSVPIATVRAS